jgi:hypothetical protein
MAKQEYKEFNFKVPTYKLIAVINDIVDEYLGGGYTLTVRQLYYQLVARDHIPNTEKSYKKIVETLNNARLAGLIDWDAIEDRTRSFVKRPSWSDGHSILSACASQFHMDMWEHQQTRVFVVVEKEALSGVVRKACHPYDVPFLSARGYPSVSVLRDFVESDLLPIIRGRTGRRQDVAILHLGDHDPSGIDMTRDLDDRIQLFAGTAGMKINLHRIALTMDQIEAENPPPNPAKQTDARFKDYQDKYGDESWELDALPPEYLNNLISEHVKPFIDPVVWTERQAEIENIKQRIKEVAEDFA